MFSNLPRATQLINGKESSVGKIWEHSASFQPLDYTTSKILPNNLNLYRKQSTT